MGRSLLVCYAIVLICRIAGAEETNWRSGWCSFRDEAECDELIATARELHFHALITKGPLEKMRMFSEHASRNGVESYLWFSPIGPRDGKDYKQKLRPEEEEAFQKQQNDKQRMEHGYQGGGAPLPGHREYLWISPNCLDYPEVMAATKEHIRKYVEGCSRLTGIALDMFGYQNYRDCVCPASEDAFKKWLAETKLAPDTEARAIFFLRHLAEQQNELCDFARALKPEIKITVHVWPTFLPEPIYGNRLNLDYCAQTCAWFFLPYWSDEAIARHTEIVVNEAKKYYPRPTGVPFVGLSVGKGANGDKSPERFLHEVNVIFESTRARSLSVFDFKVFLEHPEYATGLKDLFTRYGIGVIE